MACRLYYDPENVKIRGESEKNAIGRGIQHDETSDQAEDKRCEGTRKAIAVERNEISRMKKSDQQ